MNAITHDNAVGLLGDTPARDYARKLSLFNAFAAPELQTAVQELGLWPGMSILDAGCGTGETLRLIQRAVAPSGIAVGMDLATAHTALARSDTASGSAVIQGTLLQPPLRAASFDLIWCANTIHHLRNPLVGALALTDLLRAGGRLVFAQSALVPELLFAWDADLERRVADAVRSYYQARYKITNTQMTAVRGLVGLARRAQLKNVSSHTIMIERIAPLAPADCAYLVEAIFRDTWGERLRPYLSAVDFAELTDLCDPSCDRFALARADYHYMQSLTIVSGYHEPAC